MGNVIFPFYDYKQCRVTNIYGIANDLYASGKHDGIDIVSDGNITVRSITSGKVIRSGINIKWGQYIVIEMSDMRSVVYAHLLEGSRKVVIGNLVRAGQEIAKIGNTGSNTTGSHLHIEIQRSYYISGNTDDIAQFLGIKNELGAVQMLESELKKSTVKLKVHNNSTTVEAYNIDGVNHVPIRFLEKFGYQIGWNDTTKEITITYKE